MKKITNKSKPALFKKTIRISRKEYKTWLAYLRNYKIISDKMESYENDIFFWSPKREKFICGKDIEL